MKKSKMIASPEIIREATLAQVDSWFDFNIRNAENLVRDLRQRKENIRRALTSKKLSRFSTPTQIFSWAASDITNFNNNTRMSSMIDIGIAINQAEKTFENDE